MAESNRMAMRMEARDALEVFVDKRGHICLQQEDAIGNEPSVITLEPSQIPAVIEWLQRLLAEAQPLPQALRVLSDQE